MKIEVLGTYTSNLLELETYREVDASLNGLQVGRPGKEIHKVCFAVDASLRTFKAAARKGADAVFVHHGLFWGTPLSVTGSLYERILILLEHDMALLAAHLPLDAHAKLGNNATMARLLDLQDIQPFGMYHGLPIGFKGTLVTPESAIGMAEKLHLSNEQGLHILAFGPEKISTVGIVSGGATFEVMQAIDQKLDAYITGEAGHSVYAACEENHITMICGGHYATEVFGVQQLASHFAKELKLETEFLALPTSL